MHFQSKKLIKVGDTDSSQRIYFTNVFRIALETFEEYMHQKKFSVKTLFGSMPYSFVVAHAQADYFGSISAGDMLCCHLSFKEKKNKSFEIQVDLFLEGQNKEKASINLIFVTIDCKTGESIPLPVEIELLLKQEPSGHT